MMGKIEGEKRIEKQRRRWLDSIIDSVGMDVNKFQEIMKNRGDWRAQSMGCKESKIT